MTGRRSAHLLQGVGDFDELKIDVLQQILQLSLRVEDLHVERVRVVTDAERSRDRFGVRSVIEIHQKKSKSLSDNYFLTLKLNNFDLKNPNFNSFCPRTKMLTAIFQPKN